MRLSRALRIQPPRRVPLAALSHSGGRAPVTIPTRALSTSTVRPKGIMPDTSDPFQKAEPQPVAASKPELSDSEYHKVADEYLDRLLSKLEELQEERTDVDVEYSVRFCLPTHPAI